SSKTTAAGSPPGSRSGTSSTRRAGSEVCTGFQAMLRNRPLIIGLLIVFALIEARLAGELMAAGFDWRPLWGAPIVRGTMVDFTFTVIWTSLYLFDTARRQRRNGWAWLP